MNRHNHDMAVRKQNSRKKQKTLRRKIKKEKIKMRVIEGEMDILDELIAAYGTLPHPVWSNKIPQEYWEDIDKGRPPDFKVIVQNHIANNLPIITVSRELEFIIEDCDLNEDLPCNYTRLPFKKGCYFHLPYTKLKMDDSPVKGFYMVESEAGIIFAIVSDDSVDSCFLIPQCNHPIGQYLDSKGDFKKHRDIVNYIVMLIFYCNSAQYRTELRPEYSDLIKAAQGKHRSKKKKVLRKAERKYDYILISPQTCLSSDGETGVTKSPHFRRGYFRLQHYGPRWSMEKMIFVEPCFVNGGGKPKDYMVD